MALCKGPRNVANRIAARAFAVPDEEARMSSAEASEYYRDFFNRGTLELTFKVLRHKYPSLALRVQNIIVSVYPRGDYHTGISMAELPLDAASAARIVQALSALSDQLATSSGANPHSARHATGMYDARNPQRGDLTMIRSLLLDWLMFARARCYEQAGM
jgi:hypothetical protein